MADDARVGRDSAEVLVVEPPSVRVGRTSTELLTVEPPKVRSARASAEVLVVEPPRARVGRTSTELLVLASLTAQIARSSTELLILLQAALAGSVSADLGATGALRVVQPPVHLAGTVSADLGVRGSIRFSRYLQGSLTTDYGVYGRVGVTPDPLRSRLAVLHDVRGALRLQIALQSRLALPLDVRGDLRVPSFPHFFPRPVSVFVGARSTLRVRTPPPNDLFANATAISGDAGAITGTNLAATVEPGEPAGATTVWWQWTAPYTGDATVTTQGSNFNTVLEVFTGTAVKALTSLGRNDDVPGSITSAVAFPIRRGTVYYLRVGGAGGAQGSVRLTWVSVTTELASWSRDDSQRFRADVDMRGLLRLDIAPVPVPARFGGEAGVRVHRSWVVMPDPVIGPDGFPV